ncbi:replication factor C subunit 1 isoform X2 [Homo sapiens]|uniref:replication factor C subunit 1 isoform X2 n=1 Tax=Homo sapiens TaxID=9606 RepID=UPI001FB0C564|nr:replication factor C subunit 1 isoform X2 [Homo sapiens]XP_054206656.1 replication factor C subunit 1 isoform X2 [Homo sapiens]
MDIRKFFGVIPSGKKLVSETVKKNEKTKSDEETLKAKKGIKEIKVNSSRKEDDFKQKQPSKKKRIIYDSDSESEETLQVKNAKKPPEKLPVSSKPGKISRQDPVTYISETDEEDDFMCKKAASKSKENGRSTNSHLGTSNMKKNEENTKTKNKPLSPIKLTPTSVLDYFGTGSVQRSNKKMVASKRKELSQNTDESGLNDEAIAKQLQLDEDAEARKDTEAGETFSSVQANLSKAEKHKYPHKVKTAQVSDERKSYSPRKQSKYESSKESQQHSKSSADKIGEVSSPKASSKLAIMKRKEESSYKEIEPVASKRKENAIKLKGETKTPKKTKSSPAKKESVSPEDSEKKRTNYQAYRSYLNREGPKALGSKEIPKGAENCLEGLIFVITGVLESIERDEAKSLIERYGGKVTGNVSKKTNYLVMGRDSGQSKSDKAAALGTKIIDEDGLLNLIRTMPGKKSKYEIAVETEELGYSYVELNASDTRSKSSLKAIVAESLNNTSIKGFYSNGAASSVSTKHALIMDEVDGMAGNEDRGGIQELIGLIKHTKIPIICMCNDRNHPKIRSLVHYCFDLRFQRPRVEQIKGAMMSIAFKEGLKIPPPAMNEIILGANQDIRQVLHNLSMWCARSKALTYDQAKADSHRAKKDIKMGPFDVARKVFAAGEETAHMSLVDKSDLFFHDYSIAPLFVQENYIHVKPVAAGGDMKKHLMLLSRAADSICDGDLVDSQIRSKQNWSLLPAQAIYASVLPGELMRGYMTQFPTFPSWLGKHSSTGKHDRIVQDLALHMSLRTYSSKRTVNMDYLSLLRDALVQPLTSQGVDGVQDVVALMDTYYLMKEDFENIMEISSWGGKPSPFSKLDPKVKAAFTRAYNKEAHLTPYSLQAIKASRHSTSPSLDSEYNEELNEDDSQSDEKDQDAIETDAMIKKKTKSSKPSKPEKDKEPRKGKGKSSKK